MTYNYNVYRAKKTGDGVAARFSVTDTGTFLTFAKQAGQKDDNATFDWVDANKKPKCCVSLGLADIGQILAVFDGKVPEVKLYHEFTKGETKTVTSINIKPYITAEKVDKGFSLGIFRGEAKYSIGLSHAEVAIVKLLLQEAVFALTKYIPQEKKV